MSSQIINNFYVVRLLYIIIFILLGFYIIKNLQNKDKIKIKEYIGTKNINLYIFLKYLSVSFIIRIFLEQLVNFINIPTTEVQLSSNIFEMIVDFVATCIFAPIFEEIIFRFGLYKKLNKRFNIIISIIITSVIFALVHLYNIDGFIILVGISIIWNYSFYKTDNLIYPTLLHFFHNIYAFSDNLINYSNYWYILLILNLLCYLITTKKAEK